jgi:phosphoribosylanthranilate isomerase
MKPLKLKVCGMRQRANIQAVADLQPDYLGFIFYPQSARYVGEDFEMPMIAPEIQKVGVFVNQDLADIISQVAHYQLAIIQLHGNETPAFCYTLQQSLANISQEIKIIKAFGVDENFDFALLQAYEPMCDFFLFDTKTPQFGGAGLSFDWQILAKYTLKTPIFMSGGISLANLADLLAFVRASRLPIVALDVNSRFEIEPALKDVEKLKTLVDLMAHLNH